jgi:hypothetical protein
METARAFNDSTLTWMADECGSIGVEQLLQQQHVCFSVQRYNDVWMLLTTAATILSEENAILHLTPVNRHPEVTGKMCNV